MLKIIFFCIQLSSRFLVFYYFFLFSIFPLSSSPVLQLPCSTVTLFSSSPVLQFSSFPVIQLPCSPVPQFSSSPVLQLVCSPFFRFPFSSSPILQFSSSPVLQLPCFLENILPDFLYIFLFSLLVIFCSLFIQALFFYFLCHVPA